MTTEDTISTIWQDSASLTDRQEKAIVALLNQPTITAAATQIGVGERTIHTWLSDPMFMAAYRQARRQVVSQALARLQHASSAAVTTLLELAEDEDVHASSRVAAAKAILDLALRAAEVDIEERIASLEDTLAGRRLVKG
jgi:hypothetical protein